MAVRLFSLGTPVSSTNKTDRHKITEMLLKLALSTTNQTNLLHFTEFDIIVNVFFIVPDVSVPVTSVLVQYGDTAVLSCDIVSQLKLTSVTWTRDSVDIVIDNSKYEGANINTHHLTINNFQTSDYGNYVCSATTAMGEGNSGEINGKLLIIK